MGNSEFIQIDEGMTSKENMSQRYFKKVQATLPAFDMEDLIESRTR